MEMSLEQTDHFLRHVKMHADEVKLGTFKKDKEDYLKKLKEAQKEEKGEKTNGKKKKEKEWLIVLT